MAVFRMVLGAGALIVAGAGMSPVLADGTITIWMDADRGVEELRSAASRFESAHGVSVVVVSPTEIGADFEAAAATGNGPDIVLGPHHLLVDWARAGLIAPVAPPAAMRDAVLPVAWDAMRFDGETWGYPVAVSAAGLIYNADLIDGPPETLEEIAMMPTPPNVRPILWDYTDPLYSFPLMAAGGGYAFARAGDGYDIGSTGVNSEGAKAGAEAILELIEVGAMPEGVDHAVTEAAMNQGETLMVIDGPEAWARLEASGINFEVGPIPSVRGAPAVPFVEVYSAAISATSPDRALATELLEDHLLTEDGLTEWNSENALGPFANAELAATQADDDRIAATLASVAAGVPMPPNPEMDRFRAAMRPALAAITSREKPVEAALDEAAERILAE